MTTHKDLDKYHGALAHEFNRIAHNEFGWCVKGCGYEKLFGEGKRVKEVLGSKFTPETLFTRSWPDYYLWGRNLRGEDLFWMVEVKGPPFISPDRDGRKRVRVEAYQALLLHHIQYLTGMKTVYAFMNMDRSGVVCPVDKLPVEECCETQTFREKWPEDLRNHTQMMFQMLYRGMPTPPVSDPPIGCGSSDPFLAFDYDRLVAVSKPVRAWFEEQHPKRISEAEHLIWEGKAHMNWPSFLP